MAFVAPFLPLIVGGVSAAGAVMQGVNQAQQLGAQSSAADYNARVLRNQASAVLASTSADEATQRRNAEQVLGQQRAAVAESGIGFEGSGNDILRQSRINAELDALKIRYGGVVQAQNLENAANLQDYQSSVYSSQVPLAYIGAGTSAITSGLTGYAVSKKIDLGLVTKKTTLGYP